VTVDKIYKGKLFFLNFIVTSSELVTCKRMEVSAENPVLLWFLITTSSFEESKNAFIEKTQNDYVQRTVNRILGRL